MQCDRIDLFDKMHLVRSGDRCARMYADDVGFEDFGALWDGFGLVRYSGILVGFY